MDASTDAYSESISAETSSEGSQVDDEEGSYFWQMLTFGYTVEWYAAASPMKEEGTIAWLFRKASGIPGGMRLVGLHVQSAGFVAHLLISRSWCTHVKGNELTLQECCSSRRIRSSLM